MLWDRLLKVSVLLVSTVIHRVCLGVKSTPVTARLSQRTSTASTWRQKPRGKKRSQLLTFARAFDSPLHSLHRRDCRINYAYAGRWSRECVGNII